MPKRLQRSRRAGYLQADGTKYEGTPVYVGRPSGWGNPFRVGEPFRFADGSGLAVGVVANHETAVYLFQRFLANRPDLQAKIRDELAARDLACWCKPADSCHADVLLRVAAGGEP
jgi:hypothetical protein